mgnify:CR=1 FL=1
MLRGSSVEGVADLVVLLPGQGGRILLLVLLEDPGDGALLGHAGGLCLLVEAAELCLGQAARALPLTLLALSLLLSQLSLRSLRLRALICGTPTVLIRGGKLQQDAMRKNRFTIDELMEELREQGVTRIEDVKYAVLENSGQLTVFPWTAQQPPTAEQLGLGLEDDVTLPMVIINDGRVIHRNLTACGRDENWLRKQLSREKASSPREIFLLTLDEQGQVFCVRKERES